jgi:hypothetical protein
MAQKERAAQLPSPPSMESTPAAKLTGKLYPSDDSPAEAWAAVEGDEKLDPANGSETPEEEDEESDSGETETRILIDHALVNTVEEPDEDEAADTLLTDFRLETEEALDDDTGDLATERFMPQLDTPDADDDDAEATASETILLDELAPTSSLEDEPADVSGEDPTLIEIPRALPDEEDADDEPDRDLVIEPLLDSCAKEAGSSIAVP